MYSNKLYTPLRYPGGKARFAPQIASIMETNGLVGGHYLEPYAGGAGVALELLFHDHASHIHINDLDPAIYNFWTAVTTQPDEILTLLEETPVSMEQWYRWRKVLRGESEATLVEKGFATLFLNRTNRSGILKGGVIGGLKQDSDYKLDARYKKDVLIRRIEKIAERSKFISVYCEDAFALLRRAHTIMPAESIAYLDPPYYVKGKGLYRNFYEHSDHEQIAQMLQEPGFSIPWVVSYDNVSQIREMYKMSRNLEYGLNYTAQKKYIGTEIMFFASRLFVPDELFPSTLLTA